MNPSKLILKPRDMQYLQTTVRCPVESYSTDVIIDVVRQSVIIPKPMCEKSTKRIARRQIKDRFPGSGDQIQLRLIDGTQLTASL